MVYTMHVGMIEANDATAQPASPAKRELVRHSQAHRPAPATYRRNTRLISV